MGNPTKEYIFEWLVTLSFLKKFFKKGSENVPILLPLANPPDAAEIFGKKIKKMGGGDNTKLEWNIYAPENKRVAE